MLGTVSADPKQILQELEALDFDGKGEAFVESRFLTPMLACLGYETHRDYEVVRYGDDGSAFKLHYGWMVLHKCLEVAGAYKKTVNTAVGAFPRACSSPCDKELAFLSHHHRDLLLLYALINVGINFVDREVAIAVEVCIICFETLGRPRYLERGSLPTANFPICKRTPNV
jgi:hypothetical protein